MKKRTYIANWKMTMSSEQAFDFYHDNFDELSKLTDEADIIICPSFVSLGMLSTYMYDTNILLGAQNCSEHAYGAFTGEVDALSLSQVGASFCIVGHSERRTYYGETDEMVEQKVVQLIANSVTPIVCIGETATHYERKETFQVLEKQLMRIAALYKQIAEPLYIAYEPVWAIGTGAIPTVEQLETIVSWLHAFTKEHMPKAAVCYIYGGSVNPENVKIFKSIEGLDGFLIGGASSDFQTFKNIVV